MEGTSRFGLEFNSVLMNTSNETTSGSAKAEIDTFHPFTFYFTGICIIVGLLGNTTSIIVFLKARVSEGACTVRYYLIALALSDNTVLIAEAFVWLADIKITWIHKFDALCKGAYYFRYAGRMWSAFLTLTITAERYLFVAYPLKSSSLRTTNWCRIGILVTAHISFSLASYALFLIGTSPNQRCIIYNDKKETFVIVDIIISRCLADVIIGSAIFILTGFVIRSLLKARHARENTLNGGCSFTRRQTREFQITIMLITIAILFVLMKVPYTFTYYLSFKWNTEWRKTVENQLVGIKEVNDIAGALVNLNYSINFFVYFIFVRSFRENLFELVACRKDDRSSVLSDTTKPMEAYKLTTNC